MATEYERQEAIVDGMNGMIDILEIHTEVLGRIDTGLTELKDWLQTPPSNDLPDLLMGLKASVDAMVLEMQRLPERIVRAMQHGELDGRG